MYVCIASACCVSMCTFVLVNPALSPRSRCARFPSRAFRVSIRTFVTVKQVNRVPTLPEAQTSQDSIGRERVCDGLRAVIRCSVAALQLRQYLYCCANKASKLSTAESDTSGQVGDRSAFPIATKNSTSMAVESRDSVRSAVFRLSRAAAMTAAPSERMLLPFRDSERRVVLARSISPSASAPAAVMLSVARSRSVSALLFESDFAKCVPLSRVLLASRWSSCSEVLRTRASALCAAVIPVYVQLLQRC